MTTNDRLALELGRALLRALVAEERAAQLQEKLDAQQPADTTQSNKEG